jgi:hypothetical protein
MNLGIKQVNRALRHIAIFLIALVAVAACSPNIRPISPEDQVLSRAFEQGQRNLQVTGQGRVKRLLADDNDGSRHQRFILELDSGQTLLISHNIDLAPKIYSLSEGDRIEFCGEYEWTSNGGVVHWTHHDPLGRHQAGWLKHGDRIYQ